MKRVFLVAVLAVLAAGAGHAGPKVFMHTAGGVGLHRCVEYNFFVLQNEHKDGRQRWRSVFWQWALGYLSGRNDGHDVIDRVWRGNQKSLQEEFLDLVESFCLETAPLLATNDDVTRWIFDREQQNWKTATTVQDAAAYAFETMKARQPGR